MGAQVTRQARAAEWVLVELRLEVDMELGERAFGLLVEQPERITNPGRGARAPCQAAVRTRLGYQPQIAVAAKRLEPAIQRAFGDRFPYRGLAATLALIGTRPQHGLAGALAQRRAPARLVEARIYKGCDLLEAPGGDRVRVGHRSRLARWQSRDARRSGPLLCSIAVHENRLGNTSTHELDHATARRRHPTRQAGAGKPVTVFATAITRATADKRSRRASHR